MTPRWLTLPIIFALAVPVVADTTPPVYQRVDFAVEVAREVSNDQVNAVLSVELSDKDAGRLAQQLTLITNDALKKAAAYSTVKATTGTQHTWPVYGNTIISSSKLESWRSRAEIRIESRDFKAAGELIGKLQEKMQMNDLRFVVAPDTRRKVEDSLTTEAIAAFKSRADTIRTAWNAKGYKLVQMNLNAAGSPVPMRALGVMAKTDSSYESKSQNLAGGETRLVINVSGTIELQP